MATFTPKRRRIENQLDEWGVLLDTPRLKDEDNWSYKRRLLDVMAHRANSTYLGLIYGITRELGYELYEAAEINYSGAGARPVIEVKDRFLYLYSNYPNTRDAKINIWQEASILDSDRTVYLYELKEKVESYSGWSFTIKADDWNFCSNIYNQSNRNIVTSEDVPQAPKFKLRYSNILDYNVGEDATIWFSDTEVFNPAQKKTVDTDVQEYGDWYIDAENGIVIAYGSSACTVRYEYLTMPYTLMASPIEIYDIASSGINSILFDTVELDDGTESYTGFTDIGWDVFLELLAASKDSIWGDE